LLLILSPIFFGSFIRHYEPLYVPYSQISQQFKALVPDPQLKIVAPNIFWYDVPHQNFRDIGALTYSRWYTGGRRDVALWLSGWKPDILVTDAAFNHFFLGPGPTLAALTQLLQMPVQYLGNVEAGIGS